MFRRHVASRASQRCLRPGDLPGKPTYSLLISDQPVLAEDVVRFEGEPVALIAATDMESSRRALASIDMAYEVLVPLTDPERARVTAGSPGGQCHPARADRTRRPRRER